MSSFDSEVEKIIYDAFGVFDETSQEAADKRVYQIVAAHNSHVERLMKQFTQCTVCAGKGWWFVKAANSNYPCQECGETGWIVAKKALEEGK